MRLCLHLHLHRFVSSSRGRTVRTPDSMFNCEADERSKLGGTGQEVEKKIWKQEALGLESLRALAESCTTLPTSASVPRLLKIHGMKCDSLVAVVGTHSDKTRHISSYIKLKSIQCRWDRGYLRREKRSGWDTITYATATFDDPSARCIPNKKLQSIRIPTPLPSHLIYA